MKEKSEIKTEYGAIKPMDLAVGIAYQFGYAVCGFFAAKGQAVGGVAPFGMSLSEVCRDPILRVPHWVLRRDICFRRHT